MKRTFLQLPEHVPARAAFPAIDAHNHLWGSWGRVAATVRAMDACGVVLYADLTANLALAWSGGGYALRPGRFEDFVAATARRPRRFYGFTTATLAPPRGTPLRLDAPDFLARTLEMLRDHARQGARGLKILKELGLHYRDGRGRRVFVDDPRLGPVWEACADLGLPVLMHQSDPVGFFEPVTPDNEHYDSLAKYPDWSFADRRRFPRKAELIRRRDAVLRAHPRTTFLLPHVANYPENLARVGRLLDRHRNVWIDLSARLDELGRQPYTARAFCLRHRDRILFGTDMPASTATYRAHFRFLETYDENIVPPDYDGTFGRHRWRICGLGLPRPVLADIYYRNALRAMPSLRSDYAVARAAMAGRLAATSH
jgi:predicted TIM-barrel fold metal-dependent hydrolase